MKNPTYYTLQRRDLHLLISDATPVVSEIVSRLASLQVQHEGDRNHLASALGYLEDTQALLPVHNDAAEKLARALDGMVDLYQSSPKAVNILAHREFDPNRLERHFYGGVEHDGSAGIQIVEAMRNLGAALNSIPRDDLLVVRI